MFEWIQQQIHSNQFLAGGALMAGVAAIVAYGRQLVWLAISRSKLLMFCECHFESNYDFTTMEWLTHWVANHEKVKRARRVTIKSRGCDVPPELTPAPGRHFLRWRGRRVILERNVTTGNSAAGGPFNNGRTESWTLYLQGNRTHLNTFIAECQANYQAESSKQVSLFVSCGFNWEHRYRNKRPLETIIMRASLKDELVDEMETFWNSKDKYTNRGRPWRRGYLLEGPPGNGKTSFALAVASRFDKPIYMFNISAINDGASAVAALTRVPDDAILLIEDMDRDLAEIAARDNKPKKAWPANPGEPAPLDNPNAPPVSVSLLLQALDGLLASEGRLLFITTNHPERIDPALLRPGRIDRRVSFEPSREQYAAMYAGFFPEAGARAAQLFAGHVASAQPNLAAVQDLLLRYGTDYHTHVGELAHEQPADFSHNGHADHLAILSSVEAQPPYQNEPSSFQR